MVPLKGHRRFPVGVLGQYACRLVLSQVTDNTMRTPGRITSAPNDPTGLQSSGNWIQAADRRGKWFGCGCPEPWKHGTAFHRQKRQITYYNITCLYLITNNTSIFFLFIFFLDRGTFQIWAENERQNNKGMIDSGQKAAVTFCARNTKD